MLSVEKQMLFLLSCVKSMQTRELLTIYEKRGYAPTYLRNTLSRLKKEGFVDSPSRSVYCITEQGRSFITLVNDKPRRYGQQWDEQWHVVLLSVPEQERRKRDLFRNEIQQYGFGILYNGVYISPWDRRKEVSECVDKLELSGYVSYLQGTMELGRVTPGQAERIWELDQLDVVYRASEQWYQHHFLPQFQNMMQLDKAPAADMFMLYLQLGEVVSDLFLKDPMLPDKLLPKEWNRNQELLAKMMDSHAELIQAVPADSIYAPFFVGRARAR
ncbi:PaaX family transcriptional regulator C-terminal domain-containing protein [Paenibacillus sp. JX-17]|uniref:PaaX family transcriptional regulator C-terminal domain-containing protein n=1 Tax=Paenibacillus lacisoli TaxID=3064525 RepID=A0ABT9CGC5_9BACL|nr:PaaX family transcriptional regulator C-terminal domain-containing protein [Paenibacillus sp. JX-17]MDO7908302.1 PaaX family transcriptional regulator C-terminal domain-containing protein [Paenibacillus sp. JX-17]